VTNGAPLPLLSLSDALEHLPALVVTGDQAGALSCGKVIERAAIGWPEGVPRTRILRPDGTLLAVAEEGQGPTLRTLRVFNPEQLPARENFPPNDVD
jgi:hypothetical protein